MEFVCCRMRFKWILHAFHLAGNNNNNNNNENKNSSFTHDVTMECPATHSSGSKLHLHHTTMMSHYNRQPTLSPTALPSSSSTTTSSEEELIAEDHTGIELETDQDQDQFWKELKRSCKGCWSGGIMHTSVALLDGQHRSQKDAATDGTDHTSTPTTSTNTIRLIPKSEKLNFRLWAEIPEDDDENEDGSPTTDSGSSSSSGDVGTWTVWNVKEKGDVMKVPISRKSNESNNKKGSKAGPSFFMYKIWFDGILIRTSTKGKIGIEIGFWDNRGQNNNHERRSDCDIQEKERDDDYGMRRTVVIENELIDGPSGPIQRLSGISVIQQKKVPSEGFVGNAYDEGGINILPDESSMTWSPLLGETIRSMRIVESVTVSVPSMERGTIPSASSGEDSSSEFEAVTARIVRDLNSTEDNGGMMKRFIQTLPNGITLSVPITIDDTKTMAAQSNHLYFGRHLDDRSVHVVDIVFEGDKPVTVTLYKFE